MKQTPKTIVSARGDREEFLFFQNGEHRLFGAHFEPRGTATGLGVVLCAPFAEEKIYTHRLFTNFARQLAAQGHSVLRFDFMGQGDSSGQFEEATVETRIADTMCAADWLKGRPGVNRLLLVGLRMGAVWAGLVAAQRDDVAHLVLWDPVVNVERQLKEELRLALAIQTVLFRKIVMNRNQIIDSLLTNGKAEYDGVTLNHLQGWVISKPFYEQAIQIDLRKGMSGFTGNCLLLPIVKKEKKPSKPVVELRNVLKEQGATAELDLAIEEITFWTINPNIFTNHPAMLFDKTFAWLREVEK